MVFLFGCVWYSSEDGADEDDIRAVAEHHIQAEKSWEEFTIASVRYDKPEDAWMVLVWQEPKVYGGHVLLMISSGGEVIKEIPGY